MISFKDFLIEVFDDSYPFTTHAGVRNDREHVFKASNGTTFHVTIGMVYQDRGKVYPVDFAVVGSSGSKNYNLTHSNRDQFKILSTIRKIIIQFFEKVRLEPGDSIVFDTFSPKSANLYDKFAADLARRTNTVLTTGSTAWGKDYELLKK